MVVVLYSIDRSYLILLFIKNKKEGKNENTSNKEWSN